MVLHRLLALAAEVVIAEVTLGELAIRCDVAGEPALVQSHAHDHADVVLAHGGEEPVHGRLVEDVVDHLDGVGPPALDDPQRTLGLVVVDRYPEEANLALLPEGLDGLLPVALVEPLVAPHVELLDVEGLEPRFCRLRSVKRRMCAAGKTSSTRLPSAAGQVRFFGGTLVAT